MDYQEKNDDIAVVKKVAGNLATIELQKTGACDKCGMKSLCMGKNTVISYDVSTDIPLQVGDSVRIFIEPKYKLLSSFLLFIFPILLMIFAYIISFYLFQLAEVISIVVTFGSLLISGLLIYFLDKKLRHKLQVKIMEKVEQ